MTLSPSRRNTLKTLRKRDLAQALKELGEKEEELRKIDADLLTLEGQIGSIQNRLDQRDKKKEMLASDLESEMIFLGRLSKERREFRKRVCELDQQKEKMNQLVENLRDSAAMARRALNAIEDEGK